MELLNVRAPGGDGAHDAAVGEVATHTVEWPRAEATKMQIAYARASAEHLDEPILLQKEAAEDVERLEVWATLCARRDGGESVAGDPRIVGEPEMAQGGTGLREIADLGAHELVDAVVVSRARPRVGEIDRLELRCASGLGQRGERGGVDGVDA